MKRSTTVQDRSPLQRRNSSSTSGPINGLEPAGSRERWKVWLSEQDTKQQPSVKQPSPLSWVREIALGGKVPIGCQISFCSPGGTHGTCQPPRHRGSIQLSGEPDTISIEEHSFDAQEVQVGLPFPHVGDSLADHSPRSFLEVGLIQAGFAGATLVRPKYSVRGMRYLLGTCLGMATA